MSLSRFVVGSNIQAGEIKNEAVGAEMEDLHKYYELATPGENSPIDTQVPRKIPRKVRNEVDSVVVAVESWLQKGFRWRWIVRLNKELKRLWNHSLGHKDKDHTV